MYASSGLRKTEILSLNFNDVDFENRMIIPRNAHETSNTKNPISASITLSVKNI